MIYKITYTEKLEALNRHDAICKFLNIINRSSIDCDIVAEPLCPKGNDTHKMCYEFCAYRENGMCELDMRY